MAARLGPSERRLVDSAAVGQTCDLSALPAGQRRVRASVVTELCAGDRWPVHAKGAHLTGATVEGELDFDYGTLRAPLRLTDCHVRGPLGLEAASAPALVLVGCRFEDTVRATSLRCGAVVLDGSTFSSSLELAGASIEGDLAMRGVELRGASGSGWALDIRGIRVTGWAFLHQARVAGAVWAIGARIELSLEMNGVKLMGADDDGYSLDIRGLETGRSAFLRQGFETAGSIVAMNARIGRNLDLSGAKLKGIGPGGYSLACIGVHVGGSLRLDGGFNATGAVTLEGTRVDRYLSLSGARLDGRDEHGYSLEATSVQVAGDADLDGGFMAANAIRLTNATIHGHLSLSSADLTGPPDIYGNALAANGLRVRGDVLLRDGFRSSAVIRLVGASIDGQLSLVNAAAIPQLSLRGARCAELDDDPRGWPDPGHLELRGFRFGAIKASTGWAERIDWARRQGVVVWSPDPYEQLATYYSSIGDEDSARRVKIARNRDELAHLKAVDPRRSRAYRWRRKPFGWLLGYGYQRHRAGWLLLATVVLAGWLFRLADRDHAMVPNLDEPKLADEPCGQAYACFDPWVYGADVVLPIIDFGQDSTWRPTETNDAGTLWPRVRWALIAVGWVLASVFVAAFTKLVEHG